MNTTNNKTHFISGTSYPILALLALFQLTIMIEAKGAAPTIFQLEGNMIARDPIGADGQPLSTNESSFRLEVDYSKNPVAWAMWDKKTVRSATVQNDTVITEELLPGHMPYRFFRLSALDSGYPIDLDWDQRIAWFLYCAHDYLQTNQGKRILQPRGDPRRDFDVTAAVGAGKWLQPADIFPQELKFLFQPTLLESARALMTFEPTGDYLAERQRVYDAFKTIPPNTVLAEFSVLAWTNVGSVRVPAQWNYKSYDTHAGHVNRQYEGALISHKPIERLSTIDTAGIIKISDLRLRNDRLQINKASFFMTNAAIPSIQEATMNTRLADKLPSGQTRFPPDRKSQRAFWIAMLGLMTLIPILIIVGRKKQQGNFQT